MLTIALLAALAVPSRACQGQGPDLEALRAAASRDPYDIGPMERLAFALRTAGDLDGSIEAFRRTAELGGNGWGFLYNVACVLAVAGRDEEALDWLERSLAARLPDDEVIRRDPDFEILREHPRFRELVGIPPEGLSRDEGWRHDLAFFSRRMEQMHWDLFAHVSRAEWDAELAALSAAVGELTEAQIRARLRRLIARVGDGHTGMRSYREGATSVERFPLELYFFTDGLFVVGAPEAHAELVGGRVRTLGSVAVERALEEMKAYVSVDNAMGYRDWASAALTSPDILEAIGAVQPEEPLDLELVFEGARRERFFVERVALAPGVFGQYQYGSLGRKRPPGWVYATDAAVGELPLYLRDGHKPLWFTDLPEQALVYCWFGAVDDPPGGTFEGFCRQLFEHVAEVGAERLVLDMRLNDGGNTGVVLPLIHGLIRCDAVNRPGHLFVITGRRTFSAAMNTCSLLELHTAATFVGEPTGSRPNFVGESTSFVLPCTRYRVFCSSRYWQHVVSTDQRPWIAPALVVEPSFADHAARRDPVLDAILARCP
jgi:hypothetical protein